MICLEKTSVLRYFVVKNGSATNVFELEILKIFIRVISVNTCEQQLPLLKAFPEITKKKHGGYKSRKYPEWL